MPRKKTKKVVKEKQSEVVAVKKTAGKPWLTKVLVLVLIGAVAYLMRSFLFAAFVGYSPITRYELVKTLEKSHGQEALEELISKKIVYNEAKAKGIIVSKSEIDSEIANIRTSLEAQGGSLENILLSQGQTLADVEENVRLQKLVERLLGDMLKVSEEEARSYFETNAASFEEGTTFEDIKEDLISSLSQQKLGSEFDKWITERKAATKVYYLLNFN